MSQSSLNPSCFCNANKLIAVAQLNSRVTPESTVISPQSIEKHLIGVAMFGHITCLLLSCWAIFVSSTVDNLREKDNLDSIDSIDREDHNLHRHVFREHLPGLSSRTDIMKQGRVHQDLSHEVIFAIKQKNMDELSSILHDVSDPSSPNYGQHWTRKEVSELTSNPEARDAVLSYLDLIGASITLITLGEEFIIANAPIAKWERMFKTEFFTFHQKLIDNRVVKVSRAEKYWLPRELDLHVEAVFNVVNMYEVSHGNLQQSTKLPRASNERGRTLDYNPGTPEWLIDNIVTPYKLKRYYNMSNNVRGVNFSTQAIFATVGQHFSPADGVAFRNMAGLPQQTIMYTKNANDTVCKMNSDRCGESSLDLQYIMGMSPLSPTTHWYYDGDFGNWLVEMANIGDPPRVLSISYGHTEVSNDNGTKSVFNQQAMKFGAMGVTIFVASGDDGANSYFLKHDPSTPCGYAPDFPSVNPYITAVGGTHVREYKSYLLSFNCSQDGDICMKTFDFILAY